tara:strand:+ start:6597 stop:6947 length:351 start_codon:yes stop_codon:yes gene_type:complete
MRVMRSLDTSVYLKQVSYFNKLKKQLCKDFGDDEFDELVKNINIETSHKLLSVTSQYLTYLETKHTEMFFHVLYKIDIPEKDFRSQILETGLDIQFLSELVIKRELIKILMREKYS